MRFRHETGVRLALLSGPIVWVGTDWTELPPNFQEAAMKAGCQIDGNEISAIQQEPEQPKATILVADEVRQIIRTTLIRMIERNADGDFTAAGLPNLKTLLRESGVPCEKEVALNIYEELRREAEAA